jgi:hypothetical protein
MSKVGAPMGNFYRFQLRFFSLIGPENPRLCQWENETRFRLKEPPAKQVTLDGSGAWPDTRPAACVPRRRLLTPALSNPPPHTHADPRWRGQMFAVVCAQTHWVAQLDRGPAPRAGVARGRAGEPSAAGSEPRVTVAGRGAGRFSTLSGRRLTCWCRIATSIASGCRSAALLPPPLPVALAEARERGTARCIRMTLSAQGHCVRLVRGEGRGVSD